MFTEGFHAIYKPLGMTSHDVVDYVRKQTGIRKVGHAGTLDPLATGVLVIAIGRNATKQISEYVAKEKEYIGEITFGATSETDDAEGPIIHNKDITAPSNDAVKKVLPSFVGNILQQPPAYSALKIKGKPAYKKARMGEKVVLAPREVIIKELELLSYEWPKATIRVTTGPGVYIRALARDIGEHLGVGAYLSALERTRVGEFKKEDALQIERSKN